MPQSYGFHNLHRQSVFLSDGSEHSYFTLPADSESTFIGSRHQAMVVQDASNVFKEMPVYDVWKLQVTPMFGVKVAENTETKHVLQQTPTFGVIRCT